jgi:serine phosphatase RsbU (regulator of sigma subunit)
MKNKILIISLIVQFLGNSQNLDEYSQSQVDSLNNVISNNSAADSLKVFAYLNIASYYYLNNPDTTLTFCEKALNLSEEIKYTQGKAESYGWIGYLLFNKGETEEGILYQRKSLNEFIKLNSKPNIALAYNNLAGSFDDLSDLDSALIYYNKSLNEYIQINDLDGISLSLNNIGGLYADQGKIELALKYFHKSLNIREYSGDQEGLGYGLNNIGYLYDSQNDKEKALEYYRKSLNVRKKINDEYGIAMSLNNIGYLYVKNLSNDSALFYLNQSLEIQQKIGDLYGEAYSLNNIASVHKNKKNLPLALEFYNKAYSIYVTIGDKEGQSMVLNNIGGIYFDKNDLTLAANYADKGYNLAKEIQQPDDILSTAELLSRIYEKQGKGMLALNRYKESVKMKDSLNNFETQKSMVSQQAKYEYEKQKIADDAENDKLLVIAKEEKQRQVILKYAVIVVLTLVVLFLLFVFNRLRLTKKQKNIIEEQKNEVHQQKEMIEHVHKEITDSIRYAKRLQDAILPPIDLLNQEITQNFVLFKPKDVVSGDFYWLEKKDGIIYIAVADCTGHGVPGAMVSVVCSNALNRSLKEFNISEPAKILDKTRKLVIETFAKSGANIKDGMDISLCAFNNGKLIFAGANNPVYLVKNKAHLTELEKQSKNTLIEKELSLIEYKGNKQPVGLYDHMSNFNQTEIEYNKGDMIYLFTDGYADQFGGEKGKKLKYKPFKKLLLSINNLPLEEQSLKLSKYFDDWKSDFEQIDDVCVMGIKIS